MAIGTAFRAFFAALFNHDAAMRIRTALDAPADAAQATLPSTPELPSVPNVPVTSSPVRSDAITLLATLQREARLLDLLMENLTPFSDAQVGAAARPCLVQSAKTLQRMLGIRAVVDVADGTSVSVPENASPARYLWVGEGGSSRGKLVHHGWQAERLDMPKWMGSETDSLIIAPVQVERL